MGYEDEVWWSRLAQPRLHSWTSEAALHLQELPRPPHDPDPAALCCYGLLRVDKAQMLLRFVEGRAVSGVTIDYLAWLANGVAAEGKHVLLIIWDNATWHRSKQVREWVQEHNRAARRAQQQGQPAVRIMTVWLPVKAPWLNPIEPQWVHGKKAIVEPERMLSADEVQTRVYAYFGCKPLEPLKQKQVT